MYILNVYNAQTVYFSGFLTDDENQQISLNGYRVIASLVDKHSNILSLLHVHPKNYLLGEYRLSLQNPSQYKDELNTLIVSYENIASGIITKSIELPIYVISSEKVSISHEYNSGILAKW